MWALCLVVPSCRPLLLLSAQRGRPRVLKAIPVMSERTPMGVRPPSKPMSMTALQVCVVRTTLRSANRNVVGRSRPLAAEAITRELVRRKSSREDIEVARGNASPLAPLYSTSYFTPSP